MTIRHDAAQVRGKMSSEQIRLALNILTPEEKEAKRQAELRDKQAKAKREALGAPLFSGGDE